MYVTGSSLAEIVKITNTRNIKLNDTDRGSDCKVRRADKTSHRNKIRLAVNLFRFRNEITWYRVNKKSTSA